MPPVARFLLACVLACSAVVALPARAEPPAVGEVPPDELGNDPSGNPVRISDYRGRVVVMTFWASWCGPCLRELPILESLQKVAGRERVMVIGINWKEDRSRFREIVRRLKNLQLTLTHDPRGVVGELYEVKAIPRMFIIDRDGRIAYAHVGYDPENSVQMIVSEVNELLQRPSAAPETAAAPAT
ncbi:MAG: TlpA family protein disulfide reductase [Solimonas sp.]